MLKARKTTLEDVENLISSLRQADVNELLCLGDDVADMVIKSYEASDFCDTLFVDDELLFICGVAPINIMAGVGSPWLLGTDVMDNNPRSVIEVSKPYIARMADYYPTLENYTHVENHKIIRWLKWIGFTVFEPRPFGRKGEMFRRFSYVR